MVRLLLILIILNSQMLFAQAVPEEPEKGKIIEKVACIADSTQSYALYLPKAYDKSKTWPIILGFSPAARGTDPVTMCMEAAEKFGFIVVGSNNSRNGDGETINKAYAALKAEVLARYSVDQNRFYSIGMSGGSRVALRFAASEGDLFRGVIAIAAFTNPQDTFKDKNIFIYGIVGDEDFNYPEYPRGSNILATNKVPFWIEMYKGTHQWPAKERVFEAIEMFDFLNAKKNEPDKAKSKAEYILKNRASRIEQFISQKNWIYASALTENMLRNFSDYPNIEAIKEIRKKINESSEYQAEKKAEEEFLINAIKVRQPEDTPVYWDALNKFLELRKSSNRIGNLAKGVLGSMSDSIKGSYKNIAENKNMPAAQKGFYFHVAYLANPSDPRVPCISSYFYAIAKDKTKALAMLGEAAKLGFSDPESVEKEKDFEFLKDDPEFKKHMAVINENKKKAATQKPEEKK